MMMIAFKIAFVFVALSFGIGFWIIVGAIAMAMNNINKMRVLMEYLVSTIMFPTRARISKSIDDLYDADKVKL